MSGESGGEKRGRPRGPRRGAGAARRTDAPAGRRDTRAPHRAAPPRRDPAREAAFEVVRAVTADDAYANLVMPAVLRRHGLSGRDAGLATELAYGALRGLGTYDAVVAACVTRPVTELDPPLLDALRLGAHQLLATRVPPHAAVSTTVDLVRTHVNPGAARLANAVLRRIGEHDLDGWASRLVPGVPEAAPAADAPVDAGVVDHLAFRHSHPAWIVRALRDALGGDDAELAACLAADNAAADVHLAARPGRATVEELVAGGARPARWSPYGVVVESGSPGRFAAVRDQRAGVQDEGSQLVALALADAPLDGPDDRWLDLCAGPGGKAALLAGLATQRGARLLAVEQHQHRAQLVAQALAGDPGEHEVLVGDATEPAWPEADFDRVLLDAPCTGLGALRRRPEARWRRQPSDVEELHELQVALLGSALWSVRPGGLVAYVTCSPHLAETSAVVDDVLGSRSGVERLDARPCLPGVPDLGAGPDVQLWPHRHGTDAMYLALLRRTE